MDLEFLQEMIQEQITRVLLERLIVNRPHPWGLLITFIELIKVNLGMVLQYYPTLYGKFDYPTASFSMAESSLQLLEQKFHKVCTRDRETLRVGLKILRGSKTCGGECSFWWNTR